QHRSDRRSVVAAHDQDGGEIVADVGRVGQRDAIGLGGVAAETQRRPVVNGEDDAWSARQFLPHGLVHRFDQGRLLDARVDAEPPQFLGEGRRLEPRHRGSRPRRGVRSSFPEALDEYSVSVLERTHEPTWEESMRGGLTYSPTLVETNARKGRGRHSKLI